MKRLLYAKKNWGLAAIVLLAALLATFCSTTGGSFARGTSGYLGPTIEMSDIDVYDASNILIPGKEYGFVPMFDSGWTHEASVKDGKMNLKLGIPPEGALKPFTGIEEGTKLNISPPSVKIYVTSLFYRKEEEGMYLEYSGQSSKGIPSSDFVYLYYADQDARIKGSISARSTKGGGGKSKTTYDLTLKRGWNMVIRTGGADIKYRVGEPDRKFKWVVTKY